MDGTAPGALDSTVEGFVELGVWTADCCDSARLDCSGGGGGGGLKAPRERAG